VQPYDHANNFGLQWRMRYLHGGHYGTSAHQPAEARRA
jgi:hypothetical protein